MSKKHLVLGLLAAMAGALVAAEGLKEKESEEGFVPLFDGKSLEGWHKVNLPGQGTSGTWSVRDGVLLGVQDWPGSWCMLASGKTYGDFELRLEVKTEWPIDAGILLRATGEGRGYEVPIESRPDGDVAGIATSLFGDFHRRAADWKKAWKKDGWNEIRIEAKGAPAEIRTWLNGAPMAEARVEVQDPRVGPAGRLALEVHGPEDCFSNKVRFRNIRIREIK
jgi:hypothetical protein